VFRLGGSENIPESHDLDNTSEWKEIGGFSYTLKPFLFFVKYFLLDFLEEELYK